MMKPRAASAMLAAALLAATVQAAQVPVVRQSPAPAPSPQPGIPDGTAGLPGSVPERVARARANLEALLQGRLFVSDLSPQELQDVLDFERMVRGDGLPDNRTVAQQCVEEEVRRAGGRPTRLAWEVIKLKCR